MTRLAAFLFAACLSFTATAETITGRVVAVADGDTLTLLSPENQQYKIRLAEIDAPEKAQPYGQRSKQSLSALCFGKDAEATVTGRDKYKRFVARIRCANTDANVEQVMRGMAWRYVKYSRDPAIAEAEQEAREEGRGLWSDPNPTPPWIWRHRTKR